MHSQNPARPPLFLSTTAVALGLYLLTLPPDLTWANWGGDGGELITAAVTLGVPHPPGYPTYVLLGKLFSFLPLGTVAFRFHLFSALCAALAAGFATLTATHLTARFRHTQPAAFATGLLVAVTPLIWSQALIAEVYALNLLLVAATVWALAAQRPFLTPLLFTLSLTTHPTSLLLLPLLRLYRLPKRPSHTLPPLLLGLTPLLALPLLARGDSPIVWGDPTTLRGWWWLVSGQLYHPNAFALPLAEIAARLTTPPFLTLLLLLPLLTLVNAKTAPHPFIWPAALTALLYTLYASAYAPPDAPVLLLPACLLLNLLLMPLLARLGPLALFLPAALLLLNFQGQNLRDDNGIRPFAIPALQAAPPQAIVLTPGNETIFALWYFQHVEAQRPDLVLVDENLFAFPWYRQRLAAQHPDLRHLAQDDLPGFRAANGQRPFHTINLKAILETRD